MAIAVTYASSRLPSCQDSCKTKLRRDFSHSPCRCVSRNFTTLLRWGICFIRKTLLSCSNRCSTNGRIPCLKPFVQPQWDFVWVTLVHISGSLAHAVVSRRRRGHDSLQHQECLGNFLARLNSSARFIMRESFLLRSCPPRHICTARASRALRDLKFHRTVC